MVQSADYMLPKPTPIMLTVLPLVKARSSGIEGALWTLEESSEWAPEIQGPHNSQVVQSSQGVCMFRQKFN